MLFSSTLFLYLFLPFTLLGYYLIRRQLQNYWLLAASLLFFAWGGVSFTLILLGSIALNYVFGLLIQHFRDGPGARFWMMGGVAANVLILGVFKYANFLIENINALAGWASLPLLPQTDIVLPIGISFYTFHSLSYLVDIYRRKTEAQRNIFDLALYVCMFSQLIAGPIIRYSDVWEQLRSRTHGVEKFASGVERFVIGLGKKVLLANIFASVADEVFHRQLIELNCISAWMGLIAYTLQIYCDFSGYSDMAIGLGRMFGFEFQENFDFPYLARSVKEFWRRWHISLSSFFRDYVYIPLGGNRSSTGRTYLNLVLVFFLTGFWHGANWTFVAWGLLHGLFMLLERLGWEKLLARLWRPVGHVYTLIAVMLAWVLFRADTLTYAIGYWHALVKFRFTAPQMALVGYLIRPERAVALVIALLGAFGFYEALRQRLVAGLSRGRLAPALSITYHLGSTAFYAAVLILCTIYLVAGSYNPFIYFRF